MNATRSCSHCLSYLTGRRVTTACPVCGSSVAASPDTPAGAGARTAVSAEIDLCGGDASFSRLTVTSPLPAVAPRPVNLPQIDRYRVERQIGHGGMGVVYLARQTSLNRLVALKVMQFGALSEPQYRLRFEREAKVLADLQHPQVVRLYDYGSGEGDGQPFIAMEYVPNGTLATRVKDAASVLAPRPAAELMRGVCEAVQAVHDRGVLHRDLKPGNILLAADGTGKVADFGLAKQTGVTDLTVKGGVIGTWQYMAPEQAKQDGSVDARTDVYALGGTLYFALTGKAPFPDMTPTASMDRSIGEPPGPRDLDSAADPKLDAVVRKCLACRPEDRYQTAQAVADDLTKWLAGDEDGMSAQPTTVVQRAVRWTVRNRTSLAAAIALLVVGGLIGAAMASARGGDEAELPDQLIRNKLAARQPVVLIDGKGRPACPPQPLWKPTEVRQTGEAIEFDAVDTEHVSLVSDTQCERYTLTAEIQQRVSSRDDGGVGLFIGQKEYSPTATDERVVRMVQVQFRDWPMAFGKDNHGFFRAVDYAFFPDRPANGHPVAMAKLFNLPHQPATALPSQWRTIKLVVSPGRIEVGQFADRTELPLVEQQTFQDKRKVLEDAVFPPANRRIPDWLPRGGVGLWARNARGGFRNVVLTPQ